MPGTLSPATQAAIADAFAKLDVSRAANVAVTQANFNLAAAQTACQVANTNAATALADYQTAANIAIGDVAADLGVPPPPAPPPVQAQMPTHKTTGFGGVLNRTPIQPYGREQAPDGMQDIATMGRNPLKMNFPGLLSSLLRLQADIQALMEAIKSQ